VTKHNFNLQLKRFPFDNTKIPAIKLLTLCNVKKIVQSFNLSKEIKRIHNLHHAEQTEEARL
jgi:hypothetical protein